MAEVLSYFRSSSGSVRSSSGKIKDCTYANQPRVTVLGARATHDEYKFSIEEVAHLSYIYNGAT
jgi:hypothetical protein